MVLTAQLMSSHFLGGVPGQLRLLLSTVQIGIFPITVPILIYVFATTEIGPALAFLVWSLIVGSLDNVLKPILLGQGVDAPMAIVFVGAIGGFIASGIIRLFIGAVILVLGYKLLVAWVYGLLETAALSSPTGC